MNQNSNSKMLGRNMAEDSKTPITRGNEKVDAE